MRIKVNVYLSDSAFLGLCFSAIEVYKDECLGTLLGYKTPENLIVVSHSVPFQSAKRTPSGVESIDHRESRVMKLVDSMTTLRHVGYFHSHNQYGDSRSSTMPSDKDIESMSVGELEIIVSVNESKRTQVWGWSDQSKYLYGTLGGYRVHVAAYYLDGKEKLSKCTIQCPYAVGLNKAFTL